MFTIVCPISKCPKIQQDKNLSNFDKFRCQNNGNLKIYDLSSKIEKGGPYCVIGTGYQPIRLQESRSVSVAIS